MMYNKAHFKQKYNFLLGVEGKLYPTVNSSSRLSPKFVRGIEVRAEAVSVVLVIKEYRQTVDNFFNDL